MIVDLGAIDGTCYIRKLRTLENQVRAHYPPLGSAGMAERWPPSLDGGSRPTTRGALASRPTNQLLAVFLVASDFAAALTLRVLVEIRFVVVCERCMSLKTKRDAILKVSKHC